MKFIFLFFIFYFIFSVNAFNSLPDIRERSEWHLTRRPAPTVKQAIYHERYIDIVIGNPGHVTRLEIDFGCRDTIILFGLPEDTSRTWSDNPSTVIAYFGPVLLRLSFIVDPNKRDPRSYYPYEGYLCLGPHSDIWDYWSKLTISPFRMVLGDYDRSLSRLSYDPFEFVFYKNVSKNTAHAVVDGKNYPFLFNLENEYTVFPRSLYHNVTNLNIDIDNLCFTVDQEDVFVHLSNGFDRTMLRKSPRHDDDTIALGKYFSRNFVIYFDAVTQTKFVVPSFHLFNNGNAEPFYSVLTLCIVTSLIVLWISSITVKQFRDIHTPSKESPVLVDNDDSSFIQSSVQPVKKMPMKLKKQVDTSLIIVPTTVAQMSTAEAPTILSPSILYGMELYGYLVAIIVLITDMNGFAGYRHFNYILSTDSSALYIILTGVIFLNSLCGAVATIASFGTYRYLNIRRVFFETALFLTMWLISTHQHKTHSIIFLTVIFSAVYVNMRILHFSLNIVLGNSKMSLITGGYVILAMGFFILYNILPVMDFFFFRFDDQIERILLFLIITIGVPSLILIAWYNFSIISNTAESINQDYVVKFEERKKKMTMKKSDDDDRDHHPYHYPLQSSLHDGDFR